MAELKLKGLGKKEIKKFKTLSRDRDKIIKTTSSNEIEVKFNTNKIANDLHPKLQYVKVIDIIEETKDTKTFILAPNPEKGTQRLAYFKAGQYISVRIRIGKSLYKRPYTLSCSPKLALENKYAITIKRKEKGIVSNYFFNEITIGSAFVVSSPAGVFCYERLRDAKNVIALAKDNGITPFIAMAEAIRDHILNFNLTIIYQVASKSKIIFKERLDKLNENENIKIIYVYNEFDDEPIQIVHDKIDPYLKEENSFFVCGDINFYKQVNKILKEYNVAKKYIRTDYFFGEIDLKNDEDYHLTVLTKDKEFNIICNGKETLLTAIERNGILAPSSCHVGVCGFCRSKLISGKVKTFDSDLRVGDRNLNYIHPCSSFPESDVVIKLPN